MRLIEVSWHGPASSSQLNSHSHHDDDEKETKQFWEKKLTHQTIFKDAIRTHTLSIMLSWRHKVYMLSQPAVDNDRWQPGWTDTEISWSFSSYTDPMLLRSLHIHLRREGCQLLSERSSSEPRWDYSDRQKWHFLLRYYQWEFLTAHNRFPLLRKQHEHCWQ
jgi:hypothetical protein